MPVLHRRRERRQDGILSAGQHHGAREAPNQAALSRIRLCEAAGGTVDPLAGRSGSRWPPAAGPPRTSARVYQLAYEFIREGGKRPVYARRTKRRAHLRPEPLSKGKLM